MANKTDLVKAVAEIAGVKNKEAEVTVDAVFSALGTLLVKEGFVNIPGHGKYEVRERAARKGRNPQTNEEIDIPASKTPAFKPAGALKVAVKA